jgi:hypothetical protein
VASLRGLTRGGRESKFASFVASYHVARHLRDSRLRRGSGIVVNGERTSIHQPPEPALPAISNTWITC